MTYRATISIAGKLVHKPIEATFDGQAIKNAKAAIMCVAAEWNGSRGAEYDYAAECPYRIERQDAGVWACIGRGTVEMRLKPEVLI